MAGLPIGIPPFLYLIVLKIFIIFPKAEVYYLLAKLLGESVAISSDGDKVDARSGRE